MLDEELNTQKDQDDRKIYGLSSSECLNQFECLSGLKGLEYLNFISRACIAYFQSFIPLVTSTLQQTKPGNPALASLEEFPDKSSLSSNELT